MLKSCTISLFPKLKREILKKITQKLNIYNETMKSKMNYIEKIKELENWETNTTILEIINENNININKNEYNKNKKKNDDDEIINDVVQAMINEVVENRIDKTAISLFSGMGGDSLGIKNAGYKLIAYSEFIEDFRKSHDLNFPDCKLLGEYCKSDVSKITDEEFLEYKNKVDLIFAGFPCQGFSQAGKKLPDDPRNTLFREFLRATRLIKPKYIIGENVKGLLSRKTHDNKMYIDIIVNEFKELGYDVEYKVLKANLYGIPQNRHRLIIVGIRVDLNKKYEFPTEITNVDLNLKDIVQFSMTGSLKMDKDDSDFSDIPVECILQDLENEADEDLDNVHPNLKLLAKNRDFVYKGKKYPHRLNFGKRIPVGGEIIDIRKPLNTIICTYARQPRFFVPLQNKKGYYLRCLTPSELKQIQGFPKEYKLHGKISQKIVQIGNAVPPPLIQQVIQNLN